MNESEEQGYLVDALEMPAYPMVIERITKPELAAAREGVQQCRQVLHGIHATDPADDEVGRVIEGAAGNRLARLGRPEALGVDPVVDLRDARGLHADLALEVLGQVPRQGDVAVHERSVQASYVAVAAPAAIGILPVPAVLAVYPHRYTRRPCRHGCFQRAEISRVHDCRAKLVEQAVEARIVAHEVPRALVELDELHVGPLHALCEAPRDPCERDDRVAPALGGHAVQEVHQAVFQAAYRKAVHHVSDERGLRLQRTLPCPLTARLFSIDGSMSRTNRRSVSAAASG